MATPLWWPPLEPPMHYIFAARYISCKKTSAIRKSKKWINNPRFVRGVTSDDFQIFAVVYRIQLDIEWCFWQKIGKLLQTVTIDLIYMFQWVSYSYFPIWPVSGKITFSHHSEIIQTVGHPRIIERKAWLSYLEKTSGESYVPLILIKLLNFGEINCKQKPISNKLIENFAKIYLYK